MMDGYIVEQHFSVVLAKLLELRIGERHRLVSYQMTGNHFM